MSSIKKSDHPTNDDVTIQRKNHREKRATRRRITGLKKHQQIDNVIVEETFTLSSPAAGSQQTKQKVGDGVYISATTAGNKRYYGVMVDQSALKDASTLWLQDQSDSIDLNKRIKLLQQRHSLHDKNGDPDDNDNDMSGRESTESHIVSAKKGGESSSHGVEPSSTQKMIPPSRGLVPVKEDQKTENAGVQRLSQSQTVQNASNEASTAQLLPNTSTFKTTEKADKGMIEIDNAIPVAPVDKIEAVNEKVLEQEIIEKPTMNRKSSDSNATSVSKDLSPETSQIYSNGITRPVQKFKYCHSKSNKANDPGYRILVATFANIMEAASDDLVLAKAIRQACEEGGNYLHGDSRYYYQYEVLPTVLKSDQELSDFDIRTSMGFHSFLQNTSLPPWFPLARLESRQGRVLNIFNMRMDNGLKIDGPDAVASAENSASFLAGGTRLSMQPRPVKRYQIGVIGGGIAGVACCQELVTLLNNAGVEYQITLLEAQSRLGGRIWTDRTFQTDGSETVPIELGASWIHGIDDNPLASLAKRADVDFVTASEEVQMFGEGLRRIDPKLDEGAGKLFDDLLDLAADDCWSAPEIDTTSVHDGKENPQAAVRWYSSLFSKQAKGTKHPHDENSSVFENPPRIPPPPHRLSSDRSIDIEMGKAVLKHKLKKVAKFSQDEHRMMLWNTKNIEYALGANISDLSMKYWDSDERHAFEGDHVMLKQGYSTVIDFMLQNMKAAAGNKVEVLLDFPVGRVEYARKTTSMTYGRDNFGRMESLIDLSDTCSVTSQDGKSTKYFDFAVCACPLGVLKESIRSSEPREDVLQFQPPLPFSKRDAISNVGFGLLDKLYLKFPTAFWREEDCLKSKSHCLFGNVSGVNPHHYMFFDIGRSVGSEENAPPILMSLVSGKEAIACECLSDKKVVDEAMLALRSMFSTKCIPNPSDFRFTRWGQDRYSRGSYTFLPPGTTEQDFQILQSPINGNGESLLLDDSETMRLFFAGEHTTALHPSMAHGALLSGMRAAKEVATTIQLKSRKERDVDRIIPLAIFRHNNPDTELKCSLCNKIGGQMREGSLIAFKRGARQVLVHNNCAEFSPEVEVLDSKWKNVIRAVNRGKLLKCSICGDGGATIGCTSANCYRIFHFSCSEDAGWRFERDGKIFYCDLHRASLAGYKPHCDRVSTNFYTARYRSSALGCHLCRGSRQDNLLGPIFAFQYGTRHACLHAKCIQYSSVCDPGEAEDSRIGQEFKNVFQVIDRSRQCTSCNMTGASICCANGGCSIILHVSCAIADGWNFEKRGRRFLCALHRKKNFILPHKNGLASVEARSQAESKGPTDRVFNHALLAQFGGEAADQHPGSGIAGNLDMGGSKLPKSESVDSNGNIETDLDTDSDTDTSETDLDRVMDKKLSCRKDGPKSIIERSRNTNSDPWRLVFAVKAKSASFWLTLKEEDPSKSDEDMTVVEINSVPVGEGSMTTLRNIVDDVLHESTKIKLTVVRDKRA